MRIKYFVFGTFVFLISVVVFLTLILIADLYYHNKYLHISGLNYKGYRGKVEGEKKENETRLVMLGGSAVFGYGVRYHEALPAKLEESLQACCNSIGGDKKIKVINLAYNNEGAYAFYYNLSDFFYLDYDYVIFYSGYNDLGIGNTMVYRHSNPIFRIFGYMPILPLLIKEKMMAIKSGGNLEKAYWGEKVIFKPKLGDKIKMAGLNEILKTYNRIENIFNRLKKMKNLKFDSEKLKTDKYAWYRHFMQKAIDFVLLYNKKVIVITQPYLVEDLVEDHEKQQESLRRMIEEKYKDDNRLLYINIDRRISLKDKELSYDGMHNTPKGCHVMADIIAKRIIEYVCESNK